MSFSGKTWAAGEALGAEHRTDHNALSDWMGGQAVSVVQFGAAADGTTDDTTAIQAALDALPAAGGRLWLPSLCRTTEPLVPAGPVVIEGPHNGTAGIVNAASDLFEWAVRDSIVRNVKLVSESGGGHVFKQTGAVTHCSFVDVYVEQDNDAKSVWSHLNDAGNYLFNQWERFDVTHTRTATVPTFHFKVSTSAGASNSNGWRRGEMLNTGNYGFWFESARENDNYVYDMVVSEVAWEVPAGGCVKSLGGNHIVVEKNAVYDLNVEAANRDLFFFGEGTHATNPVPSRNCTMRDVFFAGQTPQLDGNQFLTLETGNVAGFFIERLRQNSTGTVPVDYGGNTVYVISSTITGSNDSNVTEVG